MAQTKGKARERNGQERLIEAAEILFGKHGLDGVSMRQIQLAAGSSNNFAVQYHFGDATGLVEAILASRMPEVNLRQTALLKSVEGRGHGHDVRALLDAFIRPLLEPINSAGERAYARFIVALMASPDGERHCRALFHLTPATARIIDLLRQAIPYLPEGLLQERLRLVAMLICSSIFNRVGVRHEPDAVLIDDALDMATGALLTPFRNSRRPA